MDDGLFPIETSRALYDYVRRILRTARKTGLLPSRIVMKDGTQLHYLDPHEILYVEALGNAAWCTSWTGHFRSTRF